MSLSRLFSALTLVGLLTGCTSSDATYKLPGHTEQLHNSAVTLRVGETLAALVTKDTPPAPAAYEVSLVSEDPAIVVIERVVKFDRATYKLVAKGPGQALVHYVDRFHYSPSQATTTQERADLRSLSLGSFYVTVAP